MTATTIEQIVRELRSITKRAERAGSRIGYFSALYARVTAAVAAQLRAGAFDDGPRIERLDVTFANLYLDALASRRRGGPVRAAWEVAFDACEQPEPNLLQHIYLGMNAHLLVDLPIAVAETCPPHAFPSARRDFRRINGIVRAELSGFHEDLCVASPRLRSLHRVAGGLWASASCAVLFAAREVAWYRATELAPWTTKERERRVESFDASAAQLSREILRPPTPVRAAFRAIREEENDDVVGIVRALKGKLACGEEEEALHRDGACRSVH
jgi:hypothetical protein